MDITKEATVSLVVVVVATPTATGVPDGSSTRGDNAVAIELLSDGA